MEYEIVKQVKNPLLEREDIIMKIVSNITPTKEEVKKLLGKNPEVVIVKKINSSFGKQEYLVEIEVYDSVESREKYEVVPKKIRAKMAKEKKDAEVAAKKKAEEEKAAAETANAPEGTSAEEEETSEKEEANETTKEEPSKEDKEKTE